MNIFYLINNCWLWFIRKENILPNTKCYNIIFYYFMIDETFDKMIINAIFLELN